MITYMQAIAKRMEVMKKTGRKQKQYENIK